MISPRTLAVLRIVFSALGVAILISALQESPWLGGPTLHQPDLYTDWLTNRSPEFVRMFLCLGVGCGLASLVGLATPLSLLGLWLVLLNLRNHLAWSSSEGGLQVVQCALLCLLWTPCGRLWSMDGRFGWWRRQSLWIGPIRVLQLLQVVIYLESGFYKLMGRSWWEGSALLEATKNQNFSIWFAWAPDSHGLVALAMRLITWLVLIWELTFPLWLLWRPSRILAFAIGITMHAILWCCFDVGFYPPAMLALYLTYLPDREPESTIAPSMWKKGWVALHSSLILWAVLPVHKVYPENPDLRSPVPGLAAIESAAYQTRLNLLDGFLPLRAWQALLDNLGLNHRYNTFAPTPPNYCALYRLRLASGAIFWSDFPGEGRRYSWTVVMVRSLATTAPQALPLFFQRAANQLSQPEDMVLEEWLVELGQPVSSAALNRQWHWKRLGRPG